MTVVPLWDDPNCLDGLLARFWRRLECRPDMSADQRQHLLELYTYSYGNELRIKQGHAKATRVAWRDRLRFRVAYRFPRACWACQETAPAHWHHIIPIRRGGDNRRENLAPLCAACHRRVHRDSENTADES